MSKTKIAHLYIESFQFIIIKKGGLIYGQI